MYSLDKITILCETSAIRETINYVKRVFFTQNKKKNKARSNDKYQTIINTDLFE